MSVMDTALRVSLKTLRLSGMLEDAYEDYSRLATYCGTIPGLAHSFDLDDHHRFFTGKPAPVCGTADMLSATRLSPLLRHRRRQDHPVPPVPLRPN